MKKLFFFLFLTLFIFGCQNNKETAGDTQKEDAQIEVLSENQMMVELRIEGMTCTGCENTIITGLEKLPGVIEATASFTDSNAVVSFDKSKVKIEDLKNVVEKKGYTYISSKPIE